MRARLGTGDRLVVKVGTTSLTGPDGEPDGARLDALCRQIAAVRSAGIDVVLVSSGAIAAGVGPLGLAGRPPDIPSLQAAAAVGQVRLAGHYERSLADLGIVTAQMLLTRYDFMHRGQYINARNTLDRLLAFGALPIVNENDTIAVDEIRFGDNDRLAALVGNLARARLLVLLTDASGVHARDPKRWPDAPVLGTIEEITPEIERMAGGRGSDFASGGMSSKLAAAWVATFSGVGVVVADARATGILERVVAGDEVGTYFVERPERVSARRLWIAFGQPPKGSVLVDEGARRAVVEGKRSLLAVGVVATEGRFDAGDVVDVCVSGGRPFARGLIRYSSVDLEVVTGRPSRELSGQVVIHRDQLVVLDRSGVRR